MEWNATLLEGDVPTAVAKLKEQPDLDLMIAGSGDLVESLRKRNLIDEYRLMIYPVIVGSGKRLFTDGESTMKLTKSQITDSGVAVLTYRPA
jgi:dihydrofolate reductase